MGGGQCNQFAILCWLRTSVDVPRLLWQLPWVLFRAHRTCYYYIKKVTAFQGQSKIPDNMPSHPDSMMATCPMYSICSICWRGSYINKFMGHNFLIMNMPWIGWCPASWGCYCAFVFLCVGVRQHEVLRPFLCYHCNTQYPPLHSPHLCSNSTC